MTVLQAEQVLLVATCGAFGLVVGSFLNVVVHRLPRMLDREWRAQCAELAGETPVTNLWASMLDRMDVRVPFVGDSTGTLSVLG